MSTKYEDKKYQIDMSPQPYIKYLTHESIDMYINVYSNQKKFTSKNRNKSLVSRVKTIEFQQ